ncbi:MAG: 4Fe-4S dicluster domain-containing protein [Rhodopseudomonas sp.]|nr:4Fe-4S dicluster domain-containing protein [Rhodopseudomonas sp.]
MPLDGASVRAACRDSIVIEGRHLCRAELDTFRKLAANGEPLTVACTQEAPLFVEIASEIDTAGPIDFVNIRETAGWSKDAKTAGPKMAALLAAAAPVPQLPAVNFNSEGVTLVYGTDERAIEAARLLRDHLDVTVLLKTPKDVTPPRVTDFPVAKGSIKAAKGYLGAFTLTVDGYAVSIPSSRGALTFGPARNDAVSHCDILIDMTGGTSLFPAADLRDGYLRTDPGDPAAVLQLVLKARDLVGAFDKPRFVAYNDDLCAHSRSGIVGCRRCLDLCPTGAIVPNGDHVAIDPHICAGCGQCAAACPTGAAAYALPPSDHLMGKLRNLLMGYRNAGGKNAIVMFHDADHGGALIDALARYGDGLPATVLPVEVNEVTQVGLESIAACFAYGASAVRCLIRGKPRHDTEGLTQTIALAQPILAGLGVAGERIATIATDDPDALNDALRAMAAMDGVAKAATFAAVGAKREIARLALRELHAVAPAPTDVIALPKGAPFGTLDINVDGCTLCLSCVSACPTGALSDDPEKPMLRFAEDACVQCGLCATTCPEKVITLKPQIDFRAATAMSRVIKQEEPYPCVRCGKPFGVKSSVERVIAKLEGKHWMFKNNAKRLDVIRMCDDCRVNAMAEEQFDPFGAQGRPPTRTTEDYIREREEAEKAKS